MQVSSSTFNSDTMKKFILKIILFCLILFICDRISGNAIGYFYQNAASGQIKKNNDISRIVEPDLIIAGSSRAVHHYVPDILKDSTSLEAYVIGQDGQGIISMYPLIANLLSRHTPEIIIYDITPCFDFYDDDLIRYLGWLRPEWKKHPAVDSVFNDIDPYSYIKNLPMTFRFNGKLPSILKCYLTSSSEFDKGYSPLHGVMDEAHTRTLMPVSDSHSTLKIDYLRKLMALCREKNIKLAFVISPAYQLLNPNDITLLRSLAQPFGIPVYDYSSAPEFHKMEYFNDADHLNHNGATLLTQQVCFSIKKQFSE